MRRGVELFWLMLYTNMINELVGHRVIELYGDQAMEADKRLLKPRVCKPPVVADEYFQTAWKCNKELGGRSGYPRGTVCTSQCNLGAIALRGTSTRISCRDLNSRHDGLSREWNPKPLFCKPSVCNTKFIRNKELTNHGKWEPESCVLQQKVIYGTKCTFVCNSDAQWYDYGYKPVAWCSRSGAWGSYINHDTDWSRAKCVIRAALVTPAPGATWRPLGRTRHPGFLSRHSEAQERKAKEAKMAKILSGEIEHATVEEKDEALAWRHNKTLDQEQKEFADNVRKLISDSGHDPDEVLAEAEKWKERGESYEIKDGQVYKLTNPPPKPRVYKPYLLGDTAKVNEGIGEVIDGMKEVVEGSSNVVLIIILTSLGVTILIIVVVGIYFKTRKKTAYAVVDEGGEQLLPMVNTNINNNSRYRSRHMSTVRGRSNKNNYDRTSACWSQSDSDGSCSQSQISLDNHRKHEKCCRQCSHEQKYYRNHKCTACHNIQHNPHSIRSSRKHNHRPHHRRHYHRARSHSQSSTSASDEYDSRESGESLSNHHQKTKQKAQSIKFVIN